MQEFEELPKNMRAVAIPTFGEAEVLALEDRPVPAPGPGEVLIKVAAAGVNRPDIMQRKGLYPPPPGVSDIPGLEVAGTIAGLGAGVDSWQLGDIVCALLAGGGYAEYCVAPVEQVLPVPKGLSMEEAAALPETVFTVWANVFEIGKLQKGERLLVHGGSSGIGTMAIMMAQAFGAEVYVTAGNDKKCAFCEELGAKAAINYRNKDFVAEIMALTNDEGVDVVLDMVGGDYIPRNISLLRHGGRHLSIGFLGGVKAEISFAPVLLKSLVLTGSTLRPRSPAQKGALAQALLENVWPLVEAGQILPVIDTILPLSRVADAHRHMEGSQHIGKIVLLA